MNDSFLLEDLNPDQVSAVTQMDNAVVAAGAGSGKTFVLARRFAYLVIEKGFPVDSILTLTFTQKAAAEMYDRIYKTLKEVSLNSKANPEQKKRAQTALDNFFSARIQTLDSYCASIVRQDSKVYGLRPDFFLDNDKVNEFIRKKAFSFLLEHRSNASLQSLVSEGKFENLATELFEAFGKENASLAKPFNRDEQLHLQLPIVIENWQKTISNIDDAIVTLKNFINEVLGGSKKPSATIEKFKSVLDAFHYTIDFPTKEEIAFYFDSVQKNLVVDNQILKEIEDNCKKIAALLSISLQGKQPEILKNVKTSLKTAYAVLYSLAIYIFNFETAFSLLGLLEEFDALCVQQKRLLGMVTFSDVASLAVDILKNNINIRNIEKKRFNAIMIDEFQDNNDLQREMLYLLAENHERRELSVPSAAELLPDKLFFVGDEKQSIYLFRGADVSVFRRLKNELSSDNLSLKTNYRSVPGLIAAFNSLFGGFKYPEEKEVLQKGMEDDRTKQSIFLEDSALYPVPEFEAEYEYVLPNFVDKKTKQPLDFDVESKVHFAFVLSNTDENSSDKSENAEQTDETVEDITGENLSFTENQAILIAKTIKQKMKNSQEPVSFQDFAILLRTTTSQYIFEKYLRSENIPYTSENVVNFFGDGPINDMYSLLRLLVFSQDIAAYGIVLHSPFVGLSQKSVDTCITHLASHSDSAFFQDDVLELLESETQRVLYKNAQKLFALLQEKQRCLSIHELITYFWYNLGYRYETLWNFDVSLYCDLYDFLYELAQKFDAEGQPLIAFVEYLAQLKEQNKIDELDIPLERTPGVRIMTIHKSKGLEFPYVFIPSIDAKGRNDSLNNYVLCHETYGTSFNFEHLDLYHDKDCSRNFFFYKTKEERNKKAEAELRRLLYVAITRAEKEVYLLGKLTLKKEDVREETQTDAEFIYSCLQSHSGDGDSGKTSLCMTFLSLFEKNAVFASYTGESDKNSPFTLELIPSYNRFAYWSGKKSIKEKKDVIAAWQEKQKSLSELEVYSPVNNHLTPSSFHAESTTSPLFSSEYAKIDDFISKTNKFTHAEFGTLVHMTIEAELQRIPLKVPAVFLSNLTNNQLDEVLLFAKKMADTFLESDLGKERINALQHFSEFTFKSCLVCNDKEFFVDGQMDLIIEKETEILLVDFKTDLQENPQIYYNQLALYYRACKDIFQKEVRCYLFYVRSGHSYEITDAVQKISLDSLVQDTLL